MSDSSYSEVLEYCQEKLNEGDYLKIANFLQTLHKDAGGREIVSTSSLEREINVTIDWKSMKGKPFFVHINKIKKTTTVYKNGQHKDEIIVFGDLNRTEFELEIEELLYRLMRLQHIYGVKDIEQTVDEEETSYKNFGEYREHLREMETQDMMDDMLDEDDFNYTARYIWRHLLTITDDALDW